MKRHDVLLGFAREALTDLAERRDHSGLKVPRGQRREERINGEIRRMFLRGRHICYQGKETKTDGKPRFRGSDSGLRLTVAITACEMYLGQIGDVRPKGTNRQACLMVARIVLSSRHVPLRSLYLQGVRGPRPKAKLVLALESRPAESKGFIAKEPGSRLAELDKLIQLGGKRHSGVPNISPVISRLGRTIAGVVRTYRRDHPEHLATFEMWVGAFQLGHPEWRDADWYRRAEVLYRGRKWRKALPDGRRVALEPDDPWIAMQTASYARVLYEQGKYAEAMPIYRRAIVQWQTARGVPNERRVTALTSLKTEMLDCQSRAID